MRRVNHQPGRLRMELGNVAHLIHKCLPTLSAAEGLCHHNSLTDVVCEIEGTEGTIDCSLQIAHAISVLLTVHDALSELCQAMDCDNLHPSVKHSNPAGAEPPDNAA